MFKFYLQHLELWTSLKTHECEKLYRKVRGEKCAKNAKLVVNKDLRYSRDTSRTPRLKLFFFRGWCRHQPQEGGLI